MNLKNTVTAIACFLCLTLHAQWQQYILPLDNGEDLYGISFLSNSEFVICSNTQISKTNNSGQSWQVKSLNDGFPFVLFAANTVKDLHFFNQNEGLATGVFNLTNDELVIGTADGNNTWTVHYSNSPFTPPVYFNAMDVRGSNVLVCGENGHIIRSTNAGTSFSTVGFTQGLELNDIKFLDANNAIALGGNAVLRSNNGGVTWTPDPVFAGSGAASIAIAGGGLVYMVGADGLLKSTDNGGTFNSITLPAIGGIFALAATHDTLFAATGNGILVSTNGGSLWQQFQITQNKFVRKLEIYQGKVYALCNNKTLLVLDIAAMKPEPLVFFGVPGGLADHYCTGETIQLVNQSATGNTYAWLHDNVVFSTAYNAALLLTEIGNDTISLVVSNANGSDTSSITFYVDGHFHIDPFTISANLNPICDGYTVQLVLPVSQPSVGYQVWDATNPVGVNQGSFGPPLYFPLGQVYGTTKYTILGTHTFLCFTDSFSVDYTVVSETVPPDSPFYLSSDTICYFDSAFLVVPNSLPGYGYTWHNYTTGDNGNTYTIGTGATISIPLPTPDSSQVFAPMAISPGMNCSGIMSPGKLLRVENPQLFFTLNNFNPELGEAIYTLNSSSDSLGSFQWDFGNGATPQFSSAANPANISYGSSGGKIVKLLQKTPYGCLDSITHTINVLDQIANTDCRFAQGTSILLDGMPLSLVQDNSGNMFYWHSGGRNYKYLVASNHGDSIVNYWTNEEQYSFGHFLTKFNAKGVPQWTAQLRHRNRGRHGAIQTDAVGNVYCTYFHDEHTDNVRVYSSDGRYVVIDPPTNGISGVYSIVLLKFNKDGIFQWYSTFLDFDVDKLALKLDPSGNLYVSASHWLNKFNSSGQLVWAVHDAIVDIDIDSQGFIWAYDIYSATIKKYDPETGARLFESTTMQNFYIRNIKLDALNNLYLAGTFDNTMTFGNEVLNETIPGGVGHANVVLAKMKPDGTQEWVKQLNSRSTSVIKGIEIKNNHILLMVTAYDTIRTSNLPPLPITYGGHYIYHTDSLGGSETLAKLYDSPDLFANRWQGNLINFNPNSDDLALAFEFENGFEFAGAPVEPIISYEFPNHSRHNFFIAKGSLDCFVPDIPTPNTPYSYFIPSTYKTCAGESVHFEELSSNNPTTWQWSFPGGTPSSSTAQHPTVTYPSAGTYTVTLISSNTFGAGSTFQKTIQITAPPVISVVGDSIHCVNFNLWFTASSDDPNATYQWQDSTALHGWADIDTLHRPDIIIYTQLSDNGNKYRCVVSTYCRDYYSKEYRISVLPLPDINFAPFPVICNNNPAFTLTNGTPAGGVYTGYGMVNDSVFWPKVAGIPVDITYTYTGSNGCTNHAVEHVPLVSCFNETCQNRGLAFHPGFFNTTSEHVDVPVLNGFPANTDFTVGAWFVIDENGGTNDCFDGYRRMLRLSGAATWFEIGECDKHLIVSWKDTQTHGPVTIFTPPLFGTNPLWHQVTVTRKANQLVVYVDGVQRYTSGSVGALDINAFRLGQGADFGNVKQGWTGIIDDVRLWKEARTKDQVQQDLRSCLLNGTEPNLVLYWSLDEGEPAGDNSALTHTIDATPNGNHGVFVDFPLNGFIANYLCSEAPLLYADFYYPAAGICGTPVQFANPAQAIAGGNYAYLWDFGDGTTSNDPGPVHQFQSCGNYEVCLTVSSNGCSVTSCNKIIDTPPTINCPPSISTIVYAPACSTQVNNIKWRDAIDNCAVTFDYTVTGTTSASGVDDVSGLLFQDGTSFVQYTVTDLCGNTASCNFEVTVNCMECNFDLGQGLGGNFPFEGSADDASVIAINGVVNDATLTTGYDGVDNSAYYFNGTSARIYAGNDNRGVTDQVTVAAWVRTYSNKGQWVAGKYDFGEDRGYHLAIGNNLDEYAGQAVFAGRDGTQEYHLSGYSNVIINDGQWHCLIGMAADQQWQLYVDGVLASSAPGSTLNLASSQYFTIGWHTHPSFPLWMDGDIDNVRVYNRALTPCEIESVCTAGEVPVQEVINRDYPIRLFPNPNAGAFSIELPEAAKEGMSIRIIGVTGQLLMEQPIQSGLTLQTVEGDALPPGLHFLQVISEGRVVAVEKFVKQ